MDNVLHFLGGRIDDWRKMMSAPAMLSVLVLLCLLLVVDIHRRGWRLSWSRRAVKGVFATIAIFHLNLLLLPLVWLIASWIEQGYEVAEIPSIPVATWAGFPAWSLVVIAIFGHDLANYWSHRLMHLPWLWPVHAIHHSDPDVNGLTAYRVHVLEALVMWTSYTLLLTWLGMPADAIGVGAVLVSLHIVYVHVDIDWGHGPFALLLASPRFHRWHHVDVEAAHGNNLANIFPFLDWMFGTYYVPGPCKGPLGARGVPEHDVAGLMLFPITEWLRLARERIATLSIRQPAGDAAGD